MSSTEPPSRTGGPRSQPQDTKAARDELSSKGKVEKVREIDADEQTRKKRFLKYYKDDTAEDDHVETESRPSPFDLLSGKQDASNGGALGSSAGSLSDDVEDAIISAPNYTPPPSVGSFQGGNAEADDESTIGALPQSDDFWEDFGLPDQPLPPNATFTEQPQNPMKSAGFEAPPGSAKEPPQQNQKGIPGLAVGGKGKTHPKEEKRAPEPSPFGVPGKTVHTQPAKPKEKAMTPPVQGAASKKLPSPFEAPPKSSMPQPKAKPFQKEGERNRSAEETYTGPVSGPALSRDKKLSDKTREEGSLSQEPSAIPLKPEEREAGSGDKKDRDRDKKTVEIEHPSLPTLPNNVQPMAMNAATQAAPYLNPSTVSLFFQMVGTMFVMAGPQGVNRTEIVLNNPAYAGSKFFGSTITIEKYATAPDSFNIRLTGSQEAVVSFKENIPSLMSAFENGNFTFRVNRLDVDYHVEKPMFRRKEKAEDKGDAGGGDLGERRK